MEGAPPVANQIDLFMHFLGESPDGLVARRVDLDTISSRARRTRIARINDHSRPIYCKTKDTVESIELAFEKIVLKNSHVVTKRC